jgi:hypothetical protein
MHDFYAATDGPDIATVEIAAEGGSWTTLDAVTGGPLRGPLHRWVDLSAYAGRTHLQIRFRFATTEPSGPVNHWWWQVDDVLVQYSACTVTPTPTVLGGGAACVPPGSTLSTESYAVYQWRKDGMDVPGATGQAFAAVEAGDYSVRVTDSGGCEGDSPTVPVTTSLAPDAPSISGSALSCSESPVQLAALGGPYAHYQWYQGGSVIPGATGSTYDATASGWYAVEGIASNECSAVSSGHALVVDRASPEVTGPAHGCGSVILSTGLFSSYRWFIGGVPIPGAAGQTYEATSDGDYSVQIGSAEGCMATSPAHGVTVTPFPAVTGDGANVCPQTVVPLGAAGPYAAYQWQRNDRPIAGEVWPTLAAQISGNYSVVATDAQGCTTSSPPHPVAIGFCATSEVSPEGSEKPLRLGRIAPKGSAPATAYSLTFQSVGGATGYNIYEGTLGSWYSHGGRPGNICDAAVTDLGDGLASVTINLPDGDHYYLVTAHDAAREGPSGYDSSGSPIDAAQSTCAP